MDLYFCWEQTAAEIFKKKKKKKKNKDKACGKPPKIIYLKQLLITLHIWRIIICFFQLLKHRKIISKTVLWAYGAGLQKLYGKRDAHKLVTNPNNPIQEINM